MSSSDEDDSYYGPKPPSSPTPCPRSFGPSLPPGFARNASDEDDDEETFGPLLPNQQDVTRRYDPVETSEISCDKGPKREEWMTVIPEKVEKKLGVNTFKAVTSFSKRPVEKTITEPSVSSHKDEEIEEALKTFNDKKRQASLLTIHQDKLKKKKTDTNKIERKPLDFDPEKDLHIRNFDETQTKSVIDKSKLLNTRFSSGSSKFL